MSFIKKNCSFKISSLFGGYLWIYPVNIIEQPHGSDQCGYIHLLYRFVFWFTVVEVGDLCRLGCEAPLYCIVEWSPILNVQCRILLLWPQHGTGKRTSKMHRHEIAILLYQKNACPLEQMGQLVQMLGILWRRDKDQEKNMQTSKKRSPKSQLHCGMCWREWSSEVRCIFFIFNIKSK